MIKIELFIREDREFVIAILRLALMNLIYPNGSELTMLDIFFKEK